MRLIALAALLALSACATPEQNCMAAQGIAIAADIGGSWAADAHYADAGEVCAMTDQAYSAK